MIKKEIEGKELKQVLHFRFSFEPRFSEVDKSLFLAPPLRATSCNVHYSGSILYDNEREIGASLSSCPPFRCSTAGRPSATQANATEMNYNWITAHRRNPTSVTFIQLAPSSH